MEDIKGDSYCRKRKALKEVRDNLWEYLREDPRSQASQCKDPKSKEMQGGWCGWSREKKR